MSEPERHELREALRGAADAATPRPIDVDAVLRASRGRRRARRTAVIGGAGGVAAVLAVGGLVLGLQQGFGPASGGAPAAVESAESGEPQTGDDAAGLDEESATGFRLVAPADVNRCGAPPATATDAATASLLVTVAPPASPVEPGGTASATVTITNGGTTSVDGELWGTPAIAVVDDGVTVSRSLPAVDARSVSISLDPGESTRLPGAFSTTACTLPDAAAPNPGQNATPAPLAPGAYELGAVVGFTPAGGEPVHLVSPLVRLTLD